MEPKHLRLVLGLLLSAGLASFSSADSLIEQASTQAPHPNLPAAAQFSTTVSTPPDANTKDDALEVDDLEVDGLDVNVVKVSESFYRLVLNDTGQAFNREATTEARPGDLIELVINAVNQSDQTLEDIELINSVPSGPIQLLADSFRWDPSKGLYRISRDGETFFQADAELDPADIRFIQWLIFSLRPAESLQLAYRIQLDP
jgi:hypothetical protein